MNSILGKNNNNTPSPRGNNPMEMLNQFKQFASSFKGDPKQEVMNLVQNGKMSQAQLQQLMGMTKQVGRFLK